MFIGSPKSQAKLQNENLEFTIHDLNLNFMYTKIKWSRSVFCFSHIYVGCNLLWLMVVLFFLQPLRIDCANFQRL